MIDCYHFRFFEPQEDKRKSLIIFFSSGLSADSITRVMKEDIMESLVPKNVYIGTLTPLSEQLLACLNDTSLKAEFDSFIGDFEHKLKLFAVDHDGNFISLPDNNSFDTHLSNAILDSGVKNLFIKRKGLITSSPSYHFEKPSGDHCSKFIRASNLLTSSVEVAFLSIRLLSFLDTRIKRIYVDTSSISYLISTALMISRKFTDHIPFIESYESYAALGGKYDFIEGNESLVIISATTSGSLSAKIKQDTNFTHDQIITLIHTGLPPSQTGLFNVSEAIPNGISSHKAHSCPMCINESRLVRIVSEQFIPEVPTNETIVIKKTDFTPARSKFLRSLPQRQSYFGTGHPL